MQHIPIGTRFGQLVVIGEAIRNKPGRQQIPCRCDCGVNATPDPYDLRTGRTWRCRQCGYASNVNPNSLKRTHPQLYGIWLGLKRRCCNPNDKQYPNYGGRGIVVCEPWRKSFAAFMADVGERPKGVGKGGRALYSIDRIDNNGDYEPGNVRWATGAEQAANRRKRRVYVMCRRDRGPHEMTEANTRIIATPNGKQHRRCRQCDAIAARSRNGPK